MIELMIVVVVIGILSAIAIPKFQQAIEEAKIKEAQAVLKAIRNAEKVFKAEHGNYIGVDIDLANYPHINGNCPNNPPGNVCDSKNRAWTLLRIEEIADSNEWRYGIATEWLCNVNGCVGTCVENQRCTPFAERLSGPNVNQLIFIRMDNGGISNFVAGLASPTPVDCSQQ